jgi:hypothetical protein
MKNILIQLTHEQQKLVEAHIKTARNADIWLGKPGIVAAQVFSDHMVVGFIQNGKAMEIIRAITAEAEAQEVMHA